MFDSNEKRKKSQIEVELYLDDGSHFLGKFGIGQSERLSDLMNDGRDFLPFETSEGHVVMIRKTVISKVVQLDADCAQSIPMEQIRLIA
jgi:hypothetical protein